MYLSLQWSHRLRVLAISAICFISAIGCEGEAKIPVHPVSGQVLHRGQPLPKALVVFHDGRPLEEQAGRPIPRATTDAEGRFQLSSYAGTDGAPESEYKVTVFMPGAPPPTNAEEEAQEETPDRLGSRYADPETSGLTATVKPGNNELPPFELK
jgi:hypothetical protein